MRLQVAVAGCLLAATMSTAEADLADQGNQAVRAWSDAAAAFRQAVEQACPTPIQPTGPAEMSQARQSFKDLALRWQEARSWWVGPGAQKDMPSQVWFWPDPHGSAARQIARALAEGQPQGMASTGLGLAEIVLYGDPGEEVPGVDPKTCPVLLEVGREQAMLAKENSAAFVATRLSEDDRRRLLFVSMRDTLDRISQEKIARPLGLDIHTARGQRAEAWRSGLSLDLLGASLTAVRTIYDTPDGMAERVAGTPDGAALNAMVEAQFDRTQSALDHVDVALNEAVIDPAKRIKVESLLTQVQQLRLLLVERVAPAIGETLGFNSLDGD